MTDKILYKNSLNGIVKRLRKNKKTIVFTNGCFDILHRGHIEYLKKAKKLGDILIVGLNADRSVKRIKGEGRPIQKQSDRLIIITSLSFVDYAILFNESTPINLIKQIKPDVLVKGGDWLKENIVGNNVVSSYGGKVLSIPYLQGKSTSNIISKICGKNNT